MNYKILTLCAAIALGGSCYSITSMANKEVGQEKVAQSGFGSFTHEEGSFTKTSTMGKTSSKGGFQITKPTTSPTATIPARSQFTPSAPMHPTIRFTQRDRTAIHNYYRTRDLRAATLPSRVTVNIYPGRALPRGITRYYLPSGLVPRLPRYSGYAYYIIGCDIVIVSRRTGHVVDVLYNAVPCYR